MALPMWSQPFRRLEWLHQVFGCVPLRHKTAMRILLRLFDGLAEAAVSWEIGSRQQIALF
eukprot:1740125-Amphidinium_carterae.3